MLSPASLRVMGRASKTNRRFTLQTWQAAVSCVFRLEYSHFSKFSTCQIYSNFVLRSVPDSDTSASNMRPLQHTQDSCFCSQSSVVRFHTSLQHRHLVMNLALWQAEANASCLSCSHSICKCCAYYRFSAFRYKRQQTPRIPVTRPPILRGREHVQQ